MRGDMLDNGKNADNAVMLLLCLTDSLLGCLWIAFSKFFAGQNLLNPC